LNIGKEGKAFYAEPLPEPQTVEIPEVETERDLVFAELRVPVTARREDDAATVTA